MWIALNVRYLNSIKFGSTTIFGVHSIKLQIWNHQTEWSLLVFSPNFVIVKSHLDLFMSDRFGMPSGIFVFRIFSSNQIKRLDTLLWRIKFQTSVWFVDFYGHHHSKFDLIKCVFLLVYQCSSFTRTTRFMIHPTFFCWSFIHQNSLIKFWIFFKSCKSSRILIKCNEMKQQFVNKYWCCLTR